MRRHAIPFLLLLLCAPAAVAQPSEPRPYLPLDVGNSWSFVQIIDHRPGLPVDTLGMGTFTIGGTATVNDTTYHVFNHGPVHADTVRADSLGRIWARLSSRDVLLLDFTLPEDQMYTFRHPGLPGIEYQVRIDRGGTETVVAGRFEACVTLSFDDPGTLDEEKSYTFAPGVGFVMAWEGDHLELSEARVGGQTITGRERPGDAAGFALAAYPQPFAGTTTLTFELPAASHVRLRVYDGLGREVARLVDGFVPERRGTAAWDAAALPSGVYHAVLEAGGHVRTRSLVLRR